MVKTIIVTTLCITSATTHAEWNVRPVTGVQNGCALESGDAEVFDGYQDTALKLAFSGNKLLVITESNVDASFNDIGLRVDGNAFIPADRVVDERNILFTSDIGKIVDEFIKGRKVVLYLRFWPSYPATKNYQTTFALTGFTRSYSEFRECAGHETSAMDSG